MSTDLRAFLVAVATSLGVILVVALATENPATFDDRTGGSGLWNFIYNFQTLIAGFAAVVAAGATVLQMQLTDAASETRFYKAEQRATDRHNQLMELQVRADRLRFHRMYEPRAEDFADALRELHEAARPSPSVEPDDRLGGEKIANSLWAIQQAAKLNERIQAHLGSRHFEEGENLLDGWSSHYLSLVREASAQIEVRSRGLKRMMLDHEQHPNALIGITDAETLRTESKAIEWAMWELEDNLGNFLEHLDATAKQYGV